MEDTTVVSTTALSIRREVSIVPPSEQAVAQPSIRIDGQSFSEGDALKVASTLLECLSRQVHGGDAMWLAFHAALALMPEHERLIQALYVRADQIRQGHDISGMYD